MPLLALSALCAGALAALPATSAQAASHQKTSHAAVRSATQAAATAAFDGCDATYLCFWVNTGRGGAEGKVAGSNPNWADFSQSQCAGGTWNNCASSLVNAGTSGLGAQVYEDTNYKGGDMCLSDDEYLANLTNYTWADGSSVNDSISSNNWETEECGGG
jgi:hypothetical protein